MSTLEAIVLGAVQGLTEFLPISSTAHLRIVPALLGWADPGAAYSAVIQCGTLAAVCLAMRRDIAALLGGFLDGLRRGRPLETAESRLALMIALGTLPIVAVGFATRHLLHGEARRLDVVTTALVAATALMACAELVAAARARARSRAGFAGGAGRDGLESVRFSDATTMGLFQVLALVPGTSRSGVTISSGILTGLDRRTAARFSFLLSLPAVAARSAAVTTSSRRASPRMRCRAVKPTATIGSVPRAIITAARDSGVARGRPERRPARKPVTRLVMSRRRATITAASVPHWITAE